MLIINRYKCPIKGKITIQAHHLDSDLNIVKSYPKMITDDLTLFKALHDKILICDVIRSSMLSEVNLIVKDK